MKRISIFLFLMFSPSLNNVLAKQEYVYLGGESLGIVMDGEVEVSSVYSVLNEKPWSNTSITEGSKILSFNNQEIKSNNDLKESLEVVGEKYAEIEYITNDKVYTSSVKPIKVSNTYSLGISVTDSLRGIGTLTYIEENLSYGALGHIIKTNISNGYISNSSITSITKGVSGSPGYKAADISNNNLGTVSENNFYGIFGNMYNKNILTRETKIAVGNKEDVEEGFAEIYTVIDGNKVETFDILITDVVKQDSREIKSMKLEIVDKTLIEETGGIIQGMSGSPIVQNDKIIGAVTHVLIDEPTEGYGVYIEWMLN